MHDSLAVMPLTAAGALRVAIVDPEPAARSQLRQLLEQTEAPPSSVVLECGSTEALLVEGVRLPLDAVFLDIAMPGGWAMLDVGHWQRYLPDFVFVTTRDEHALRAFDADAADYLTKPVSGARLIQTLSRLWRLRRSAGALGAGRPGENSGMLSARQDQILNLLSREMPNKAIARTLGLSHFTVRNHVTGLFRLFGVSRRGDLARAARTALVRQDVAERPSAFPGAPP